MSSGTDAEATWTLRFTTHTQVMVIALIVLVVMFFMSFYYSISQERGYLQEGQYAKVTFISRLLSLYYQRAVGAGNPQLLRSGVDELATDEDLAYIRVLVGTWDIVSMARGFRPDLVSRKTIPVFNELRQPAGQIILGFWSTPRGEGTSKLTWINLVIVGDLLVLFGLVLHLLLKEIVTRPLENFVEATKRIAQGDFESYLEPATASSEQERLAVSFNNMIDHLRRYKNQLEQANLELEERVRSRTLLLEQEKNRSVAILSSVADGVYTIDEDWKLTTFNPAAAKITGVPAEEALGQKCWEVLKYPFCKTDCLLKRLPKEGVSSEGEIYVEQFDKKGASFIVSGAPLFDGSRRRLGGVESLKDMTYVKRLHEQIRQVDRLSSIGVLAAGVAHEINNPLSNIKLYSQIMAEDETVRDPALRSSLGNIIQETDRATKIVRNLLEFARHDAAQFVQIAVQTALDDAIAILKHQLTVDKVEIQTQIPDNLPTIWADRGNLQQVFINLMANAQHAMRPAGGILRIRAWHDTGSHRVLVSFTDTGKGIDPENLDRIFDPFFTTKEVGEGTGLGLAITYGIVRDHGGDIRVKSRPGDGAEFTLAFPASMA
ncbi:MAG: PAS domain S-box protein [Candidatus Riflebacteria bacterium]|nr:PAS domain S-box protein [Candidatus Riflebacteria bacterium]